MLPHSLKGDSPLWQEGMIGGSMVVGACEWTFRGTAAERGPEEGQRCAIQGPFFIYPLYSASSHRIASVTSRNTATSWGPNVHMHETWRNISHPRGSIRFITIKIFTYRRM